MHSLEGLYGLCIKPIKASANCTRETYGSKSLSPRILALSYQEIYKNLGLLVFKAFWLVEILEHLIRMVKHFCLNFFIGSANSWIKLFPLLTLPESVWPDLAIFESFWQQNRLQKLAKKIGNFLGYFENDRFM